MLSSVVEKKNDSLCSAPKLFDRDKMNEMFERLKCITNPFYNYESALGQLEIIADWLTRVDVSIKVRKWSRDDTDPYSIPKNRKGRKIPKVATQLEQENFKKHFPVYSAVVERISPKLLPNLFYISSADSQAKLLKKRVASVLRFCPQEIGRLFEEHCVSSNRVNSRVKFASMTGLLSLPSEILRAPHDFSEKEPDNKVTVEELRGKDKIFSRMINMLQNSIIEPLIARSAKEAESISDSRATDILVQPTTHKINFFAFGQYIFRELQNDFTPNKRFLLDMWCETFVSLMGIYPGMDRILDLVKNMMLPNIDQEMKGKVHARVDFQHEEAGFVQSFYHNIFSEPQRGYMLKMLNKTTASHRNIADIFCKNSYIYSTPASCPYPGNAMDPDIRCHSVLLKLEQIHPSYMLFAHKHWQSRLLQIETDELINEEKKKEVISQLMESSLSRYEFSQVHKIIRTGDGIALRSNRLFFPAILKKINEYLTPDDETIDEVLRFT